MPTTLSIGDFARATHLTIKTLRHYHRVGILEPVDVDPETGYRRYDTEQIAVAQVIRRFRDLEMPLEDIRAVLSAPDVSTRNSVIASHLDRLETELRRTRSATESLRDLLGGTSVDAPAEFEHVSVPAISAASITATIDVQDASPWYQGALGELRSTLAAQGVRPSGQPGGMYFDGLFSEGYGQARDPGWWRRSPVRPHVPADPGAGRSASTTSSTPTLIPTRRRGAPRSAGRSSAQLRRRPAINRTQVRFSVDAQAGGSQHHTIARPKLAPADPHAVHRRPVRRLEVLKYPAAVAEHEARVPARYPRIVEDDVAAVAAAYHQFGDGARPVERQQIRRLRPVVRTRHAEPIDRREQTSLQPADRRPGHQVIDEPSRVDLTRASAWSRRCRNVSSLSNPSP